MYLRFIKEHPIGIKQGACCFNNGPKASSYVNYGYAEEITEKEYESYLNGGSSKAKEVIKGKVEASSESGAISGQSSKAGSKSQKSTGKKRNKKRRNK